MSHSTDSIGFKEWAFVCEALGQGVQTLILRKGGIHEGRSGFQFQHEKFWLFPTGFHEQSQQLRWVPPNAAEATVPQDELRERVDIRYFASLQKVWRVTDWDKVAALAGNHIWKDEVVRERFAWNEESCLHIALVKVFKLQNLWSFPYERGFGGCRSWVKLPVEGTALEPTLTPVMGDAPWNAAAAGMRAILS